MHWNLKCAWVDDFTKLEQIDVYLTLQKIYLVCLSETFLDSVSLGNNLNEKWKYLFLEMWLIG